MYAFIPLFYRTSLVNATQEPVQVSTQDSFRCFWKTSICDLETCSFTALSIFNAVAPLFCNNHQCSFSSYFVCCQNFDTSMLNNLFGFFSLHDDSDDWHVTYLLVLEECLLIVFWCVESSLFLNLYGLHYVILLPPFYLYTHTCKGQHTHLRILQQCYVWFLRPVKLPTNVEFNSVLQPWE